MKIYLLRHGEIDSDGIRRFIGQTDVPLNHEGLNRAHTWRNVFSPVHLQGIYASDLSRCAETARAVAQGRSVEVQLLSELREINMGKLEGISMDDFRKRSHDQWKARGEDISRFVPDGGESFSNLQRRVLPVFESISSKHQGNILIVAHAGVNRVILCHILGMPLENLFRIDQSNGCLNIIEPREGGFRVAGMNLAPPFRVQNINTHLLNKFTPEHSEDAIFEYFQGL
jgi:probable phosphoglycerate mutase